MLQRMHSRQLGKRSGIQTDSERKPAVVREQPPVHRENGA